MDAAVPIVEADQPASSLHKMPPDSFPPGGWFSLSTTQQEPEHNNPQSLPLPKGRPDTPTPSDLPDKMTSVLFPPLFSLESTEKDARFLFHN